MTTNFKENLSLIILLIIIGFFVYAFNLNDLLFWDDTDWIVNNPFVHSFSLENVKNWFTQNILAGIGLSSNYYRPFLLFTFTLNYIFGGDSPFGYHLLSNAFHIANAILIFLLLFSVFKNKFISFWASLIWLVHPLQTEAVTYVSGRGDPLNIFFMLLALFILMENNFRLSLVPCLLSLVSLVLALLSRETAVISPLLFMVFYIAFISRERFLRSVKTSFVKALPYFGIVFVYGILRLTVLNFENTLNFYSRSNPYADSLLVRMYTFMNVLWTYVELMILPLGQHMERSVTIYTYFWNLPVFLASLAIVILLYCLIAMYRREQKNNLTIKQFSHFRVCFFAVGWFFTNLLMTSGITPINAQLYEHWLYLALLGPLVLVIYYLCRIFEKFDKKIVKVLITLLLVFITIFFSTLSIKRNILWGKPIEFFEDILKYESEGARINNNLGNLYYNKGDIEKAEEYYWKSVSVEDNFPQPHFNLGSILHDRGDIRGAVVEFKKAIEIDPNFPYAYQRLAVIYAGQGDLINAADALEKTKIITPHNTLIYYNLALIYIERNDLDSAYNNLQEGLKYSHLDPETDALIRELLEKF